MKMSVFQPEIAAVKLQKTPRGEQEKPLTAETATDPRPVPQALSPHSPRLTPVGWSRSPDGPAGVYLLVDADSEDIPVPQRLLAEHQAVVELLHWLVAPGGSVGVGQADQLSAPRMQLRRHLQGAASFHDSRALRQ